MQIIDGLIHIQRPANGRVGLGELKIDFDPYIITTGHPLLHVRDQKLNGI